MNLVGFLSRACCSMLGAEMNNFIICMKLKHKVDNELNAVMVTISEVKFFSAVFIKVMNGQNSSHRNQRGEVDKHEVSLAPLKA